jgi:hypothetical protein
MAEFVHRSHENEEVLRKLKEKWTLGRAGKALLILKAFDLLGVLTMVSRASGLGPAPT